MSWLWLRIVSWTLSGTSVFSFFYQFRSLLSFPPTSHYFSPARTVCSYYHFLISRKSDKTLVLIELLTLRVLYRSERPGTFACGLYTNESHSRTTTNQPLFVSKHCRLLCCSCALIRAVHQVSHRLLRSSDQALSLLLSCCRSLQTSLAHTPFEGPEVLCSIAAVSISFSSSACTSFFCLSIPGPVGPVSAAPDSTVV